MNQIILFVSVFIFFVYADALSVSVIYYSLFYGKILFQVDRFKSYEEYLADQRAKLLSTFTMVPSTTVTFDSDKMSSSLLTVIKSELKSTFSKINMFNDATELIIGAVVSSVTGTSFFYLFKCVRNKNHCKVCYLPF